MVSHTFDGVVDGTYAQSDSVDVVRLTHSNGTETLVAWARDEDAAQIRIQATGTKAYLIDQYGGQQLVRPIEGYYTLSLSGARCNADDVVACPVGGAVWTLVQSNGGAVVEENNTALSFE
jgi:hypothetical protein